MKWQKKVFESIEIDTSQPPYVFKAQLYDLSGVAPDRQKIMVKGGLLKVVGFTACWCLFSLLICSSVCLFMMIDNRFLSIDAGRCRLVHNGTEKCNNSLALVSTVSVVVLYSFEVHTY